MYEVKKEETLKELSKKLQSSARYKEERVFWEGVTERESYRWFVIILLLSLS
jgi:hypothetical protein